MEMLHPKIHTRRGSVNRARKTHAKIDKQGNHGSFYKCRVGNGNYDITSSSADTWDICTSPSPASSLLTLHSSCRPPLKGFLCLCLVGTNAPSSVSPTPSPSQSADRGCVSWLCGIDGLVFFLVSCRCFAALRCFVLSRFAPLPTVVLCCCVGGFGGWVVEAGGVYAPPTRMLFSGTWTVGGGLVSFECSGERCS